MISPASSRRSIPARRRSCAGSQASSRRLVVLWAWTAWLAVLPWGCRGDVPHQQAPRERVVSSSDSTPGRGSAGDHVVARLPSRFGTLVVFDEAGYRCFSFNQRTAVQSCVHRKRPLDFRFEYARMMTAASLLAPRPPRTLVLGLGGAAVPRLVRALFPEAHMDVVEIDPGVVSMARRYFGYQPGSRTRVHVEDAGRFVARQQGKARYDLIYVDCYGEHFIPPHLQTEEFIGQLRDLRAPMGVVASNVWNTHPRYRVLLERYARIFPRLWVMEGGSSGNHIFIGGKPGLVPPRLTLMAIAARIDRKSIVPFSLAKQLAKLRPHPPSRK